jgi:hypothetical protein
MEPLDDRAVIEPLVPSGEDRDVPMLGRNLPQARGQQIERARGGVNVVGAQLTFPELLRLALKTEQWVRGAPPWLGRIVADLRPFLIAVDHQYRGIDVEDVPGATGPSGFHRVQKLVVQDPDPGHQCRRGVREEPPEGGRVRIALQSSEVLEEPVGAQEARRLEPLDPN